MVGGAPDAQALGGDCVYELEEKQGDTWLEQTTWGQRSRQGLKGNGGPGQENSWPGDGLWLLL